MRIAVEDKAKTNQKRFCSLIHKGSTKGNRINQENLIKGKKVVK